MNYLQRRRKAKEQLNSKFKRHGPEAFAAMRKAGQLTARGLDMLVPFVKPGVTTQRLDDLAFQFAMDHGAYPATLHYRGYTKSICTSINEVVCHGIPSDRILENGDIVNIDYTLIVDGWHGDSSRMYGVGEVNTWGHHLCAITAECLKLGIEAVRPGATLGDIGHAIQQYAEDRNCSVVRDFCGHGLGEVFHAPPNILHYGTPRSGDKLRPGMLFTIEPMINIGAANVEVLTDGWTAVTRDRSLSAQYEHTIGVTETGCEIFTLSPAGLDDPIAAAAKA
jgi:methionyl aminopeptidase